jgi:hypothetical protein
LNNKKPRHHILSIEFDSPIEIGGADTFEFEISNSNQVICYKNSERVPLKNIYDKSYYERLSGKHKVLNETSIVHNPIILNEYEQLKCYNAIFAIDTNTKFLGQNRMSVCSIFQCECYYRGEKDIGFSVYRIGNLAAKNLPDKLEEKMAIVNLIYTIVTLQEYNDSLKIAIITDHDLENIKKYNNRELPIINDFYLPENFLLIYATADAGKENVFNKLISLCDKEASKVLKNLEATYFDID